MATSLEKRLAHSHLQAAVRALRAAEKAVPGCAGDAARVVVDAERALAAEIAASAPRRSPDVHVAVHVKETT